MSRRRSRPVATRPEIALLLSTYQRPWHLKQVLASIAMQRDVADRIELVVTDDGSEDETPEVVRRFAASAAFPVSFTTHPREAFQLARCRNEGVRASTAPYLLFLDGDCVLPPDHVRKHLTRRREGWAVGGFCCCFNREITARFDEGVVRSGRYQRWAPPSELRALASRARKAFFYGLIRHPDRPRLPGGNLGVWRADYERVNGYDEQFEGWGGEDDDLTRRLRQAGVRACSSLGWTRTYHLWHPRVASAPKRVGEGSNVAYLNRPFRLTRCIKGLTRREPHEVGLRLIGTPSDFEAARAMLASAWGHVERGAEGEVEVLFVPGEGRFSGKADCNILVVLDHAPGVQRLARKAHLVVSDRPCRGVGKAWRFPLDRFAEALAALG